MERHLILDPVEAMLDIKWTSSGGDESLLDLVMVVLAIFNV